MILIKEIANKNKNCSNENKDNRKIYYESKCHNMNDNNYGIWQDQYDPTDKIYMNYENKNYSQNDENYSQNQSREKYK